MASYVLFRIEHIRTYLACVEVLGETKITYLDILFTGARINVIRLSAVRSQHLYPKEHMKAKCKDEVIASVKLTFRRLMSTIVDVPHR